MQFPPHSLRRLVVKTAFVLRRALRCQSDLPIKWSHPTIKDARNLFRERLQVLCAMDQFRPDLGATVAGISSRVENTLADHSYHK